jgi:hypothetical protein
MTMLLTVEEAKTKWCRHARALFQVDRKRAGVGVVGTALTAVNRWKDNDVPPEDRDEAGSPCIATECPAWRWARPTNVRELVDPVETRCIDTGSRVVDVEHNTQSLATEDGEPLGYCGDAGPVV